MRQQHRLRLTGRTTFAAAGIAAALALALLLTPAAGASVRCRVVAARHELQIVPFADPHIDLDFADGAIRRRGGRILVLPNGLSDEADAVDCAGGRPRVGRIRSIVFVQSGLAFNEVDLRGGPPAPRIEFRSGRDALGYGIVKGRAVGDHWALGSPPRAVELSLGPGPPSPTVTWDGPGANVPVLDGGLGRDVIDASALGPRSPLDILEGGPGRDLLLGSAGPDALTGGSGHDVLRGGAGRDTLDGRDSRRDVLDCGAGRSDRAEPGRRDVITGCERVSRQSPGGG